MDTQTQDTKAPRAKFDERTIEDHALHLPEEMRDAYRWLATFTREECNRDIHRLTERFKIVGVYHDTTTWSKILRGFWNRNKDGNPLANPVISQEKFLTSVEALRTNVRAESLRGKIPFVETSTASSIMDFIELKCAPDRVNKFGVIVGPTGGQKTATFKEFTRRRNHGSTRWVEAPENGLLSDLLAQLSVTFGYSDRCTPGRKRAILFSVIQPHHCLIIDNTQDLYRQGSQEQPAFSFLRRLQEVTGCTIILSITTDFERTLMAGLIKGYFEQFEGRSGGRRKWLRLPEHAPEEDVVAIAQAFGLQDAKRHVKELTEISREPGRIRRLFEDLQEAKILANASKSKLTIEHVREARGDE
ncbi:MAG: AAA family ATPase [Verrucomicrobiota bacterium]